MNNNISIQSIFQVGLPDSSSYSQVYSLSTLPVRISTQLSIFKQQQSAKTYETESYLGNSDIVASKNLSDSEKDRILEHANKFIKTETKNLDPQIYNLVNKNFKNLLWI